MPCPFSCTREPDLRVPLYNSVVKLGMGVPSRAPPEPPARLGRLGSSRRLESLAASLTREKCVTVVAEPSGSFCGTVATF